MHRVDRRGALDDHVHEDDEVFEDVGDGLLEDEGETLFFFQERHEVGAQDELFEQPAAVDHLARFFLAEQHED